MAGNLWLHGGFRLGRSVRAHHHVGFLDKKQELWNGLALAQVSLIAFVRTLLLFTPAI